MSVDTTALVTKFLKVAVWNVLTESCVQWTTQRYGIICERNCKLILGNDTIYAKNQTSNFNLASAHSPVVWFYVVASGAAFCLHLEGKDFTFNFMK